MPSSYTSSARFTLQATGENNNTWGVILNQGVFQLVDDSVCGRLAFALSGAKALTVSQGATDEARMAFLDVTGGAGGTITVPSVAKGYFVHNGAAGVVNLSAGGPLLPIQPGDAGPVFGDGATLYPILVGGLTITAQLAAMKSYVDSAIAGAVVNLPAMIGHAGQLLTNDGTVASWGPRISDAYAWRNRIINGGMRIDQRHGGALQSITGNKAYTADRWLLWVGSGGTMSAQQIDISTWSLASPKAIQLGTTVAFPVLAADQFIQVIQNIEGLNIVDLKWGTPQAKPVTVSFVIQVGATGDYGVSLVGGGTQSYVHKMSLVAGVVTPISFTVPGPTAGAWLTDNGAGLALVFCLGAGTNYQTAVIDAWQSVYVLAPIGQVNLGASTAYGALLTDVQLEVGTVATPFEQRPYDIELLRCQRYYFRTNGSVVFGGYQAAGLLIFGSYPLPVTMRATPAVTFDPGTGYSNSSGLVNWAGTGATVVMAQLTVTALGYGYCQTGFTADADF